MAWFPKEQSNAITNMVCQLNDLLGGTYFTAIITADGVNLYSLNLTNYGISKRKYGYLATDLPLPYGEMFAYLNGILLGIRAAKSKK